MGARPNDFVAQVRTICLVLPEAYEEPAWTGTRWRIRSKTFAHILMIAAGWPPVYAAAAGTDGPVQVLMFRSAGEELGMLREAVEPFFAPPWRADEIGLRLHVSTDWAEVTELLTESYCRQAPKKLAALLERPQQ
jgi:hypothetical protein